MRKPFRCKATSMGARCQRHRWHRMGVHSAVHPWPDHPDVYSHDWTGNMLGDPS